MKHVVIVDDEAFVRLLLKKIFEDEGFETHIVENGIKLIATLHSVQKGLVVLDVNLPWISGIDICRSIKQSEELVSLKVLCISGSPKPDGIVEKSHCDGFLQKPFKKEALLKMVRSLSA